MLEGAMLEISLVSTMFSCDDKRNTLIKEWLVMKFSSRYNASYD